MSSPIITFYIDKLSEVTLETILTTTTATYIDAAPMYADAALTQNIGTLGIKKQVLNIVGGVATAETVAIYDYECFWNVDLPNVTGISAFTINVGNALLGNGSTEVPGTYYGALNGVRSNGNFRNYGGSVQKTKDAVNPVRTYVLDYYQQTDYNTLPM
jgi:hypothetical protein